MLFLSYVNEHVYPRLCHRQRLNKRVCFTRTVAPLIYVNETMYLLGNLLFFEVHVNRFMAGMTHLVPMLS